MAYKVTIQGESFLTDDLTLDEAIEIERATGRSWVQINPFRSAEDAKVILLSFLRRGRSEEDAARLVGSLTLREVLAAIDVAPDDLPTEYEDGMPAPKAGDPGTAG